MSISTGSSKLCKSNINNFNFILSYRILAYTEDNGTMPEGLASIIISRPESSIE